MTILEYLNQYNIKIDNFKYLKEAFIHTSYYNEHKNIEYDNERLEFLGDAILQYWISDKLFKHPNLYNEGKMTTLRSQLVCEKSLSLYCKQLNLQQFLLLGIGEEKNGGRNRPSILANLFEAFIGGLYLDSSLKEIDIILSKVINKQLDNLQNNNDIIDYKTRLQEFIQADNRKSVTYQVIKSTGPANNPLFDVVVKMDDIILGKGSGTSKKRAEQKAAKDAIDRMVK